MFITPLSFRSATAWLNISNEMGSDWYSDVVEIEGKGSIGAARYGTTGCGLVVDNFGINTGCIIDSTGDGCGW